MPQTPSIGKLCMLIVLYTIELASLATHDQKLHFICVTMPDVETPLENCLYGHDIIILKAMHVAISLIVHPPLKSLDPSLLFYTQERFYTKRKLIL